MPTDAEIKSLFDQFDTSSDGRISFDELMEALKKSGKLVTVEECKAILNAADENKDGTISFAEFEKVFRLTQENVALLPGLATLIDAGNYMLGGVTSGVTTIVRQLSELSGGSTVAATVDVAAWKGKWTMATVESDKRDAMLKAEGMAWVARKALSAFTPVRIFSDDPNAPGGLFMTMPLPMGMGAVEMPLAEGSESTVGALGREVTTKVHWEGADLVLHSITKAKGGKEVHSTAKYFFKGDELHALVSSNGGSYTMTFKCA